jgi:hypothetical protein
MSLNSNIPGFQLLDQRNFFKTLRLKVLERRSGRSLPAVVTQAVYVLLFGGEQVEQQLDKFIA